MFGRLAALQALILVLALTVVVPSDAQTSDDLESIREERRQAQQEAAEQAKQVDAAMSRSTNSPRRWLPSKLR